MIGMWSGDIVPCFVKQMIEKEKIKQLVSELLDEGQFLVDVQVLQGKAVKIYIDKPEGVIVSECSRLSRKIEAILDVDNPVYELEVSSPGIGSAFKVKEQYLKCIGKPVDVILLSAIKHTGTLLQVNETDILLLPAAKKKDKEPLEPITIAFDQIKKTSEKIIL